MANKNENRIILSHSKREWTLIDRRIKELASSSKIDLREAYNRYMNKKISYFIEEYKRNPKEFIESIKESKCKRFKVVSPETYKILEEISKKTEDKKNKKNRLAVSTIIDRIILTPILIER